MKKGHRQNRHVGEGAGGARRGFLRARHGVPASRTPIMSRRGRVPCPSRVAVSLRLASLTCVSLLLSRPSRCLPKYDYDTITVWFSRHVRVLELAEQIGLAKSNTESALKIRQAPSRRVMGSAARLVERLERMEPMEVTGAPVRHSDQATNGAAHADDDGSRHWQVNCASGRWTVGGQGCRHEF
jgi:hypothetical protein